MAMIIIIIEGGFVQFTASVDRNLVMCLFNQLHLSNIQRNRPLYGLLMQ